MESDNLFSAWDSQKIKGQTKSIQIKDLFEAELKIRKRKNRIRRNLILEILIGLLIFISAGLLLLFEGAASVEISFAVKIILLTALFTIPTSLLLYQSILKLTYFDYNIPLAEFLTFKVTNLKKSVRIYRIAALINCFFILVVLLTDKFYLSQSLWLKIAGIFYVVIMAFLLSPLIRYQYGRQIKMLEIHIELLKQNG